MRYSAMYKQFMGRIHEAFRDAIGKSGYNHGVESERSFHPDASKAAERFYGGLTATMQIIMPHLVSADMDNRMNSSWRTVTREALSDLGSYAVFGAGASVGIGSGQPEFLAAGVAAKAAYNVAVGLRRHRGEVQPPRQDNTSGTQDQQTVFDSETEAEVAKSRWGELEKIMPNLRTGILKAHAEMEAGIGYTLEESGPQPIK